MAIHYHTIDLAQTHQPPPSPPRKRGGNEGDSAKRGGNDDAPTPESRIPNPESRPPLVLAIGNLDGVHLGHQALIRKAREVALELGYRCAVLTFTPHPREYFNPSFKPLTLMRPSTKIKTLAALGVDRVIFARFDQELARMPAEAFINDFCIDTLGAQHIVTGNNFYFGHQRRGDVALLESLMQQQHLGYSCVAPVECGQGQPVSSSRIRQLLSNGNIGQAALLLGRPFTLEGRVGHGDKRGRSLGFPTANIPMHNFYLPAFGVYAIRTQVGGAPYFGVANLGIRPTFSGDHRPQLEVHLFDFDASLYGMRLEVELMEHLRPEQKFDGVDALVKQIQKDITQASQLFGSTT